jgi:hypothetical protein
MRFTDGSRQTNGAAPRLAACFALACLAAMLAAACDRPAADLPAPNYGSEACDACNTVIRDPRFAAQYRSSAGVLKSFDDPACLFAALQTEPHAATAIRFHAYDGDGWISPADVWFARTTATASHGSGWAAYASFSAAQEAVTAAGSGELVSYDEAQGRVRRTRPAR